MRHLFVGLLTCLCLLTQKTVLAAWEAPYVEEAVTRAMAAAKKLKDLSKFGARSDGLCLIGGFIEVDKQITWKCKLKGGKEYIFVASGDSDVKDLDLEAWEGNKKVAEDSTDDNVPIVVLTVENDCDVTMKMKLADAKGKGDESHFNVMVMLESEGTGGKLSQLEKAAKQINEVCAHVNDKSKLEFDRGSNSVCLAAGLLESGETKTFHRDFEADSKYIFVGAADDACKDLDLEIHSAGKLLCKDEEEDATPVVSLDVGRKSTCQVKMVMHESSRPSFAIVAILTPQ